MAYEILLNRMYSGDFLTEGDNIGHEVVNLFRDDKGRNFIYALPDGSVAKEHNNRIKTILLVRWIGNHTMEILAKAEELTQLILRKKSGRGEHLELHGQQVQYIAENEVTYGGVRLDRIFEGNVYRGTLNYDALYLTFQTQKMRKPLRPIYIADRPIQHPQQNTYTLDGITFSMQSPKMYYGKGMYGMVGVVEKGYGDVKFIARSNGGHASAPTKNTPLVRLGKFMADVEKNYPFRSELSPTVREMFRRMTPNMSFAMKMIFSNLWLFEKLLIKLLPSISAAAGAMTRTTLAFTTAKGSGGYNVLPQEAYVTGNMRFIPHQDADESIKIISDFAKKYDIESEVIYYDSSCPVVDYNSKPFHMVEEVAEEVYPGIQICPYTMTGGTDAKFYRDLTPNALRFAPLYIDKQQYGSIHALNENIFKGALPPAVDFYKSMIKKS